MGIVAPIAPQFLAQTICVYSLGLDPKVLSGLAPNLPNISRTFLRQSVIDPLQSTLFIGAQQKMETNL